MVAISPRKWPYFLVLLVSLTILLSASPSTYERLNEYHHLRALLHTAFSPSEVEVLRASSFQLDALLPTASNGSGSVGGTLTALTANTVIISPLTHHVSNMFHNIRCHQRRNMPEAPIVPVSMDRTMSSELRALSIPHVELLGPVREGAAPADGKPVHVFRSAGFVSSTIGKLLAVRNALMAGFNVVLLDTDVVVCRDLRAELSAQLGALSGSMPDILIQHNDWREGGLLRCTNVNTGFYLVRAMPRTVSLFDDMVRASHTRRWKKADDQVIFQAFVCKKNRKTPWVHNGKCRKKRKKHPIVVVCTSKDGVTAQSLPVPLFPNGRIEPWGPHGNQTLYDACSSKSIFLVHVNWRKGPAKPKYLKKHKMWMLEKDERTCTKTRQ